MKPYKRRIVQEAIRQMRAIGYCRIDGHKPCQVSIGYRDRMRAIADLLESAISPREEEK